jgi:hypothetical protein
VTSNSDDVDGDVSSVAALLKNPGPDGTISLREAVEATNNSPGNYTIDFAPSLKGTTITTSGLNLIGGNVVINGDIDDDGIPDITLDRPNGWNYFAIAISSSGNTVYGLKIVGFAQGVSLQLAKPNTKYSNNTLSHLDISSNILGSTGITTYTPSSNDTWTNTVIAGNFINATGGIGLFVQFVSDDRIIHAVIVNNTIIAGNLDGGYGIAFLMGMGSGLRDEGLDSVIAYNSITVGKGLGAGTNVAAGLFNATTGIGIGAGGIRGNGSTINGLQFIGNSILAMGQG